MGMHNFQLKNKRIINAIILGCLPVLACLINLLIYSKHFSELWLGQSQWNDELFYFKQIECMVKDIIPKGFFGYNESSAQFLSFGAWSPVILMPWAVFGKIFGWTYMSPFIANIAFLTIAMILFGLLANTSIGEALCEGLLFILVTPLSRYIFSGMPEIVCLVPLIISLGLIIGYRSSEHKKARMVFLLILLAFLTLMRPYFFVFFVFPFFITRQKNYNDKLASILVALGSLLVYFLMSAKMNAPYFGDVYRTDWVDAFKNDGLISGFVFLVKEFFHYLYEIIRAGIGGIRGGYPVGIYFAAFLIVIGEYFVLGIYLLIKKDKKTHLAWCMFFCQTAMLGAICLMYSLQDGFRHLLVFIVVGMLLIPSLLPRKVLRRVLSAVNALALVWLFLVKAQDPLYFGSVFNNENEVASKSAVVALGDQLSENMVREDKLGWDNDVILVFMDSRNDEDPKLIQWQYAYGLPKGFAISLCEATYVSENIDNLKSKYIMTMSGGTIEKLIQKKGYELIASNEAVSVYEIR